MGDVRGTSVGEGIDHDGDDVGGGGSRLGCRRDWRGEGAGELAGKAR